MSELEIKVRAAILTMKAKLKKQEFMQENEVCSTIRYECKLKADGYREAIADFMKLVD